MTDDYEKCIIHVDINCLLKSVCMQVYVLVRVGVFLKVLGNVCTVESRYYKLIQYEFLQVQKIDILSIFH